MIEKEKSKKILVICQANVARSVFAEYFINHSAGENIAISAGVNDERSLWGPGTTPKIIELMAEKGIDVSGHRATPLTEDVLDQLADGAVIVWLCNRELMPEWIIGNGFDILLHEIPDPVNRTKDDIRQTREKVEQIVTHLVLPLILSVSDAQY
jgi:protein-tyrosine-phosphatase